MDNKDGGSHFFYAGTSFKYDFSNVKNKEVLKGNYIVTPHHSVVGCFFNLNDEGTEIDWECYDCEQTYEYYYEVKSYNLDDIETCYRSSGDILNNTPIYISSYIKPVVELQTNVTLVDTNYDGVWEIQL